MAKVSETLVAPGSFLNLVLSNPGGTGRYLVLNSIMLSADFGTSMQNSEADADQVTWAHYILDPSTAGMTAQAIDAAYRVGTVPVTVAEAFSSVGARLTGIGSPNDRSFAVTRNTTMIQEEWKIGPGGKLGLSLAAAPRPASGSRLSLTMVFSETPVRL